MSEQPLTTRVKVRVHAGAARTEVGGRYGDQEPPVLVVKVRARAIDGRANRAVIEAVSDAFEVKRSNVKLVSGARSRIKVIEVSGVDPSRVQEFLEGG